MGKVVSWLTGEGTGFSQNFSICCSYLKPWVQCQNSLMVSVLSHMVLPRLKTQRLTKGAHSCLVLAVQLLLTSVMTADTLHSPGLHLQFTKEKKALKDHVEPYLLNCSGLLSSKATFIDQVGVNCFNFLII